MPVSPRSDAYTRSTHQENKLDPDPLAHLVTGLIHAVRDAGFFRLETSEARP